jgi:hypothetical protein
MTDIEVVRAQLVTPNAIRNFKGAMDSLDRIEAQLSAVRAVMDSWKPSSLWQLISELQAALDGGEAMPLCPTCGRGDPYICSDPFHRDGEG